MYSAWNQLQLAQRALALGDFPAASHFAKAAQLEFQLGMTRQVSVSTIREPDQNTTYRERIQDRLRNRKQKEEGQPEPLGDLEAGLAAVDRILDTIKCSIAADAANAPCPSMDRAAVSARLYGDGTAQISAYLPSTEPANELYFNRLIKRVTLAKPPHVYIDHLEVDPETKAPAKVAFTIVGEASLCRLFATSRPHFQIVGQMVAPVAVAEKECVEHTGLLDRWLNPAPRKEEK